MAVYTVVMVRHGESEWNAENRFCGWHDADLADTGVAEAKNAGKMIKEANLEFDIAFTSVLKRAIKTLFYIQDETEQHWLNVVRHWRLNERMYGALQGLNKSETAQKHGEDQVKIWRRSYNVPPPPVEKSDERWPGHDAKYAMVDKNLLPKSECLKDTVDRVLPFWYDQIVPAIKTGKRVIIAAHGNSLRALVKYLDNMTDEAIMGMNIPTGIPLVYKLDKDLKPIEHYYLASEEQVKAAMAKVAAQGKAKPSAGPSDGLKGMVPAGVVCGDNLLRLMEYCRDKAVALPAFNCTSTSTINSILQAARDINSPVIIQFSNGGAAFLAGKGIKNDQQQAAVLGAVAGAKHVRLMAAHYNVPVILHSDHCAKKLLPWFDGMLAADEEYFKLHGEPLFSSHMLDLSEEFDEENISTCAKYFKRMTAMKQWLEMEIGITGGEEDGVDNTAVKAESLYTKPEQVWNVHKTLAAIGPMFSIAAAFGNVHGVYKAGNVVLSPQLLAGHQSYIKEQLKSPLDKPTFLVMHGGSGSTAEEIACAVNNGVIKMNIDTDTQWAYWDGLRGFYEKNKAYLQGQVGNPDGADKPNKKYYDPRVWIRAAEESMIKRANESFKNLNAVNANGDSWKA